MDGLFNLPLALGALAIIVAQVLKIPLFYLKTKTWNLGIVKSTGSMPSSHSAGVMAVASAVGFEVGFNSPIFAVAAMLAGVVMYDATGIRYQAGQHANALNEIRKDLSLFFREIKRWPELESDEKQEGLKTLLGHKRSEVLVGAITGVFFTTIVYFLLDKI